MHQYSTALINNIIDIEIDLVEQTFNILKLWQPKSNTEN